jgi:hypothetical protein
VRPEAPLRLIFPPPGFGRRGFVLFLVCTLALVMMVMIIGLSRHKSGAVLQLNRTIEQERAVTLAQAGVNEMLASVKADINDKDTSVGKAIHQFWKNRPAVNGSKVIYNASFDANRLKMTNQLVEETLGSRGDVSGQLSLVITERVAGIPRPAYLGYVELVARAKYRDYPKETRVKERREIKIVDLSDPFLDKYALFVKTFCRTINNPKKRIIVQGVTTNDPGKYSFAYLGNRSYPSCPEFPAGSKSAETPPVILDLDFEKDRYLLGSFYQPAAFRMKDNRLSQLSAGNLFFVNPPVAFSRVSGSFSLAADFHKTTELLTIYKSIVDSARPGADQEGTLSYMIYQDYLKAGGNPANSEAFRSLVSTLMASWQYHYGYTDYTRISQDNSFVSQHPFVGVFSYFDEVEKSNPMRAVGGKMPLLFGEARNTPVYVEGPVFLRFFKIAFTDKIEVNFDLKDQIVPVSFPAVALHYEKNPETFSGKVLNPPLDSRTDRLMSMPVEHFSINNFYFGAGSVSAKTPTAVKGGVEGYDVFPAFDQSLRSIAYYYQTADEFVKDRVRLINGQKTLDLDGISLIIGKGDQALDLSGVQKYRGKGKIILGEGKCNIGNLTPLKPDEDYLGIYLMYGRFVIKSAGPVAEIHASLVATTCLNDNSQTSASAEGGMEFDGKSVNLLGNLVIDNLFEMRGLPEGGHLRIVHDPGLYFPEYPVRVSVGQTRSLLAVDYAQ